MWLSEEGIAIATNRTMRKLGVENERTIILDTDLYEEDGMMAGSGEGLKLTVGKQYTVTVGGSSYTSTANPTNAEEGVIAWIGNLSLAYGNDVLNTGEPFLIADIHYIHGDVQDVWMVLADNGATHITVATETTTPIDPKYLPQGGVGYTGEKLTAVLPETVLTAENYSTVVAVNGCFMSPRIAMETGKKYRVVVDGLALDYVAEMMDGGGVAGYLAGDWGILDPSYAGYDGVDGWPWLVAVSDSMGMYGVGFADPAENAKSHTMAVYEITEEVRTIEPKYLPGVCLPVVELTTVGTSGGAALTAEESAKMEEVAALGLPIIVKAMVGGTIPASGVYSYANMGYPVFTATSSGMQFTVAKIEGIWVFMQT